MYRHPQQRSEISEFDQNQDAYGMQSHMHPQENGFHSNNVTASRLYNTAGSQQRMHSHSFSDYPAEPESQKTQKAFGSGASYRSSFSLHPISNHTRPQSQTNTSYDHSNAYGPSDMYPAQVTSPTQSSLQPFDTRGSFEFHSGSTVHGGAQRSPGLLDSYIGPQQSSMMLSQLKSGPQHHGSAFGQHSTGSYAVSSQTPFGPHIPSTANGSSTPMNAAPVPSAAGAPAPSQASHQHEEISTIFVVGFPDDMQEREFQNMFTFCPDFEAATLKIPNKEFSTYGAAGNTSTRTAGSSFHQFLPNSTEGFSNGIVVDSRDGTVSWPNMDDGAGATSFATGGVQSNVPPRKQIIGFAKFKTKEGAFRAREQLQGRRVDIEKGAILKAEMAKKNLHTKRGVGPIPGSTTSGTGMAPTGNTPQPASQPAPVTAADVFGTGITDGHTIRDSSTIGGSSRVSHWREHALDTQGNSPQFAPPSWEREAGQRSLRDRLADDEQEWRTREKLANASYLRSNPEPVEYSVGLAPVAEHLEEDFDGYTAGPWDNVSGVPQQSLSRRSSSEANFVDPSHVYPHSSRSSNEGDHRGAVDMTNPMSTDLSASINNLTLTTRQNNSSPELPSPSSNSSGGSGGKPGVDQNPPINTLYVGNLPISPLPNAHAEPLEERLRSLFADRAGYRRLSFKQKNTGPMCFVEFEDVQAATTALKALQGHTLSGLVKGGVRLSYSKNPLGVRTPTSATSTSSQQQHQTLGGAMDDNRSIFVRSDRSERRDHSQPYISSPPPPRFANANSSNASYFGLGSTQEFVPRANYPYSLANELSNYGSYARSPFTSDLLHGEPGVSRVLSPAST